MPKSNPTPDKEQVEKFDVEKTIQEIKDLFAKYGSGEYTPTPNEVDLIDSNLRALLDPKSCNVAKLVSPKSNFFNEQDNVYTVEVNQKLLEDFQKLRQTPNEDIRKTILALMEYYNNHDALNLILKEDVLAERQSYIKFTAQLASYLKHGQTCYSQVKAKFDNTTTRLGIFCRRSSDSTLNSSFLGSIVASLHIHESAEVLLGDIPISYLGNRAMLKSLLAKRLPGKRIKIHWSKESVKCFIL